VNHCDLEAGRIRAIRRDRPRRVEKRVPVFRPPVLSGSNQVRSRNQGHRIARTDKILIGTLRKPSVYGGYSAPAKNTTENAHSKRPGHEIVFYGASGFCAQVSVYSFCFGVIAGVGPKFQCTCNSDRSPSVTLLLEYQFASRYGLETQTSLRKSMIGGGDPTKRLFVRDAVSMPKFISIPITGTGNPHKHWVFRAYQNPDCGRAARYGVRFGQAPQISSIGMSRATNGANFRGCRPVDSFCSRVPTTRLTVQCGLVMVRRVLQRKVRG
jgi:hypothetical protein